jgi:hypothetical protein
MWGQDASRGITTSQIVSPFLFSVKNPSSLP